jgi:hypothetical protein
LIERYVRWEPIADRETFILSKRQLWGWRRCSVTKSQRRKLRALLPFCGWPGTSGEKCRKEIEKERGRMRQCGKALVEKSALPRLVAHIDELDRSSVKIVLVRCEVACRRQELASKSNASRMFLTLWLILFSSIGQ